MTRDKTIIGHVPLVVNLYRVTATPKTAQEVHVVNTTSKTLTLSDFHR